MQISKYRELIKNLPYLDQSFETAKEIWDLNKYSFSQAFTTFHASVFKEDKVAYSRSDLFMLSEGNLHEAIFSIILWGYPRNMRGNNFKAILHYLEKSAIGIKPNQVFSVEDFSKLSHSLKQSGIGLSTLTKLLYFFKITIEGYKCLILDSRIIEVLQSGRYQELTGLQGINDFNKVKLYPIYLQLMNEISRKYQFSEDQLELFLFMFGKNLKHANASE